MTLSFTYFVHINYIDHKVHFIHGLAPTSENELRYCCIKNTLTQCLLYPQ